MERSRLDYFNALEAYAVHRDLEPFADMITLLEEQQLDRYLGMRGKGSSSRVSTVHTGSIYPETCGFPEE